MIADASNLDRGATDSVVDTRKIGMTLCGHTFQPGLAILRAEDQMGEEA